MFKKKLSKIALLAASAAFILVGLPACSGDDDDGDGDEFKADTVLVTAAELGASATSAESSDASVVTAEVSDGGVKLTSKKEGSATVTAHAKDCTDATISVTVSKTGKIKAEVTQKFEKSGRGPSFEGITVTVVCTDESVKLTEEQLEKVQYLLNSGDETFAAAIEGYFKDADCTDAYETGDDRLPVFGDDDTALYVKVSVTKEDFLAAIEDVEVPETPDTFFESFLASDLSGDIKSEISDDDKTWVITPKSSKTLQKKSVNVTTYDGKTYTARLAANNSQGEGIIKLKIGAGQTKILRVDAGTSQGSIADANPNSLEDGTIKVGGTTWAVHLAASTNYFEVTGGDDGYVAIDLTGEKANIYAITVVDALVDTSKIDRTAEKVTYNAPEISLAEEADTNSPLTATVAKPTKTTTTYTAKADGVAAATTADKPEELTDITLKYSWSKGGEAISEATGLTYTPTAGGVYTFTASYTAEDGKTYSASKSVTVKSDTKYTVTFEAGDGSFADGATTFTVPEGLTLKDGGFEPPTPTAPEGKVFTGWKSEPDGITIDDPITKNVTFTAQYGDKPAGTPISFTFNSPGVTDANSSVTPGTYDGVTLTGSFSYKNTYLEAGKSTTTNTSTASFEVAAGAKIVISAASTGSSNSSAYKIDGAGISKTDSVTGTSESKIEVEATDSGTVTFTVTETARALRLYSITVTY